MTSAFESALNEAMAELAKQRDDLVRLQHDLAEFTTTARSKRRQVSVKVDGRGDIVELKLHGQSYRTMAANDLADLIVDTIREAKQAAQAHMWESLGEVAPDGVDVAQAVVNEDHDWSAALSGVMMLPQPIVDLLGSPPPSIADDADIGAFLQRSFRPAGDGDQSGAAGTDETAAGNTPRGRED